MGLKIIAITFDMQSEMALGVQACRPGPTLLDAGRHNW